MKFRKILTERKKTNNNDYYSKISGVEYEVPEKKFLVKNIVWMVNDDWHLAYLIQQEFENKNAIKVLRLLKLGNLKYKEISQEHLASEIYDKHNSSNWDKLYDTVVRILNLPEEIDTEIEDKFDVVDWLEENFDFPIQHFDLYSYQSGELVGRYDYY